MGTDGLLDRGQWPGSQQAWEWTPGPQVAVPEPAERWQRGEDAEGRHLSAER